MLVQISINSDSSHTIRRDVYLQAHDQIGADSLGKHSISYDKDREHGEILLAETQRASGEVIKLAASDIQIQDGMLGDGTTFPNNRVLEVTFPKLLPGDVTHFITQKTVKQLALPGGMSFGLQLGSERMVQEAVIQVSYPKDLEVQLDVLRFTLVNQMQQGERTIKTWRYQNVNPVQSEDKPLDAWKNAARLYLTTFKSLAAIAEAYQHGVNSKLKLSPRIDQLARSIVKDVHEPRLQAKLLYDWVRTQIRYVANYIGDGGFVPHDLDYILDRQYGDCKDHAILLEALL